MPSKPTVHQDTTYTWEQLSLLPYEVVEIELRVGIVVESDHLQWQFTVRDPAAKTLLGMLSSPHVSLASWPRHARTIASQLEELIGNNVHPF
jgi:hypothetical protein